MTATKEVIGRLKVNFMQLRGHNNQVAMTAITADLDKLIKDSFNFNFNQTLFWDALTARNPEIIAKILKNPDNPNGVDAKTISASGETYLHSIASYSKEADIVNNTELCRQCAAVLITAGADPYTTRKSDAKSAYDLASPDLQAYIRTLKPLPAAASAAAQTSPTVPGTKPVATQFMRNTFADTSATEAEAVTCHCCFW